MRTSMMLLAAGVLLSSAAPAQDQLPVEVGTSFGVTVAMPDRGHTALVAGVPGAGSLLGAPSVYATFFPSPSFMVEPQLAFQYNTLTEQFVVGPAVQLGHLINPRARGSAYVAVNAGAYLGSELDVLAGSIGAALGYRVKVSSGAAFRTELVYRRWLAFGGQLNDFSLRLAFGAVL